MSSFRFRKKTEYAIMMMAKLARSKALISIEQLQQEGLPRSFMVTIARDLIAANLITAKEGRQGGYSLAFKPEHITLRDIVNAVEGRVVTVPCLVHGATRCPLADSCPHLSMMSALTGEINQILARYTLREFSREA